MLHPCSPTVLREQLIVTQMVVTVIARKVPLKMVLVIRKTIKTSNCTGLFNKVSISIFCLVNAVY